MNTFSFIFTFIFTIQSALGSTTHPRPIESSLNSTSSNLINFGSTTPLPENTILIPHIGIEPEVLTSHKQRLYPHQYTKTHPLIQNEELLLNFFEKAQKHYVVKSFDLALENYKNAAQLLFTDDWRLVHRKALTLSLLRLSELDPAQADQWIKKAVSFGSDLSMDQFQVDPKTLISAKKLHPLPTVDWDLSAWTQSFDTVILNGRPISLKKIVKVKVPEGDYRIVFLSAYYLPQVLFVSQKQIPFLEPVKIPFVSGSCQSPVVSDLEFSSVEVVFSSCTLIQNANKKWVDIKNANSSTSPTPLQSFSNIEKTPFYLTKWFKITALIALGGLGYYFYNKKNKNNNEATSASLGDF